MESRAIIAPAPTNAQPKLSLIGAPETAFEIGDGPIEATMRRLIARPIPFGTSALAASRNVADGDDRTVSQLASCQEQYEPGKCNQIELFTDGG
ncbi:MAG: hypothetical protein OXG26_10450 [Caldilineaceae bacterium]|nr:hypothetical protein [Caldilineaceae bacterium]